VPRCLAIAAPLVQPTPSAPALATAGADDQSEPRSASFQDAALMVVCCALWHDAPLALRSLTSLGEAEPCLRRLLSAIGERKAGTKKASARVHFRNDRQKKIVCLGLLAILRMPDSAIEAVAPGLSNPARLTAVSAGLLDMLSLLKESMEKARLAEEGEGGSEDDAASEDDDDDDEGGELGDADLARLAKVKGGGLASLFAEHDADEDDSDDPDFSDLDWDEEEAGLSLPPSLSLRLSPSVSLLLSIHPSIHPPIHHQIHLILPVHPSHPG